MGLMDLIVEELNNNMPQKEFELGAKWERLYSEQYEIVQTENGKFRNTPGASRLMVYNEGRRFMFFEDFETKEEAERYAGEHGYGNYKIVEGRTEK